MQSTGRPCSQLLRPCGQLLMSCSRGSVLGRATRPTKPICLCRDACAVGAAKRVGNALYCARVYFELVRRFAHAHAARQSRPNTLSQFVRDRWPAESLTFTLGAL